MENDTTRDAAAIIAEVSGNSFDNFMFTFHA